jgi:hypothetical protein
LRAAEGAEGEGCSSRKVFIAVARSGLEGGKIKGLPIQSMFNLKDLRQAPGTMQKPAFLEIACTGSGFKAVGLHPIQRRRSFDPAEDMG